MSNAARGFLSSCTAKDYDESIERHIDILSSAAVCMIETTNPGEQLKVVTLLLAICNLQYYCTVYKVTGNQKDPAKYPPYHMLTFLEMNLKDTYVQLYK